MITTLEELKDRMTIPADADNLKDRFDEIAEFLMNRCSILHNRTKYRIVDAEFYFYNSKHRDITVHPRVSEALTWYINDFGGIDLNFKSYVKTTELPGKKIGTFSTKYELADDSYFGGILIRQLRHDKKILDGPWKVSELFRTLDACSCQQNNPILILDDHGDKDVPPQQNRYHLLGSCKDARHKTSNILNDCYKIDEDKKDELTNELAGLLKDRFVEAKYRYTL